MTASKKIFHEFNRRVSGAVEWGFTSIDGSKFLACNSKSNNFTKNKLDDRIKWLNGHIEEYLRILDDSDRQENFEEAPDKLTKELIDEKLKEARERLENMKVIRSSWRKVVNHRCRLQMQTQG